MGSLGALLLSVPRRVRKEFVTRGGDARFLVFVFFVLAFLWARTWVTVVGKYAPVLTVYDKFEFGRRIVILGYHPHHIALGVLLLAIAGWIGIFFAGKQLHRLAGVMYGVGLGLIVDEMGFIVEGMVPYRDDWVEVGIMVLLLGSFFMSIVYFPSFWNALETRAKAALRRAFRRHQERSRAGATAAPVIDEENFVAPAADPVPVAEEPR